MASTSKRRRQSDGGRSFIDIFCSKGLDKTIGHDYRCAHPMVDADFSTSTSPTADDAARIAVLEARIAELVRERDELRSAYDRLWLEVELMRRRIFIAKAERVDTTQLELEFKDKLAELDRLAGIDIAPQGDERG